MSPTRPHTLCSLALREDPDGEVVERLVAFTAEHGIDDIAELWSRSPSRSLPGTLWRLYLIQLMIHDDPHTAALLYERGRVEIASADPVVAGAPTPAGPDELVDLVDTILRGLFQGDFAVALDRAAAFCRVEASGASHLADDYEATEPERASALTTRALRLADYASRPHCLRGAVAARVADLSPQQAPAESGAGPQNASRRGAARSGRRWSPGLLRPGCSSVTEGSARAFP